MHTQPNNKVHTYYFLKTVKIEASFMAYTFITPKRELRDALFYLKKVISVYLCLEYLWNYWMYSRYSFHLSLPHMTSWSYPISYHDLVRIYLKDIIVHSLYFSLSRSAGIMTRHDRWKIRRRNYWHMVSEAHRWNTANFSILSCYLKNFDRKT